jgi:hypothetical protein
MIIAGTYAVRFNGFDRDDDGTKWRTYQLVGVGTLTLTKASGSGNEHGTATGFHHSTLNPMTGLLDTGDQRVHTIYDYRNGTYKVISTGGAPAVVQLNLQFQQRGEKNIIEKDTFILQQAGPDRFWLISTDPVDLQGNKYDEAAIGEAIKVDPSTW